MLKANNPQNLDEVKLVTAVIAGMLILLGALFISFRYSQKQPSDIVIPGGVTYLGPSPTPTNIR